MDLVCEEMLSSDEPETALRRKRRQLRRVISDLSTSVTSDTVPFRKSARLP